MVFVTELLVAWLLADFLSGVWHWIEDRYFEESWPIIGKYIAKPNTLHHAQPAAFLQNGYWTRNWTTILPAAIAFALYPSWVFVFVSQANEIHAWAHQKCSPFIRILQEVGVLQSPRHHGEHHRSPFEVRYCVMSDWLNPFLDAIEFWRWCEYLLSPFIPVKEDRTA
ncbi:fatty acid desaturase CarF family protein [Pirellulaceae bacterium SH501]